MANSKANKKRNASHNCNSRADCGVFNHVYSVATQAVYSNPNIAAFLTASNHQLQTANKSRKFGACCSRSVCAWCSPDQEPTWDRRCCCYKFSPDHMSCQGDGSLLFVSHMTWTVLFGICTVRCGKCNCKITDLSGVTEHSTASTCYEDLAAVGTLLSLIWHIWDTVRACRPFKIAGLLFFACMLKNDCNARMSVHDCSWVQDPGSNFGDGVLAASL